MEIVYKASDGTIFDNEYECIEYERRNVIVSTKKRAFYDKNGYLIENVNVSNIDKVMFARFDSLECIKLFNALSESAGVETIAADSYNSEQLVWMYSIEQCDWIAVKPMIKSLTNLIDALQCLSACNPIKSASCIGNVKGVCESVIRYLIESKSENN